MKTLFFSVALTLSSFSAMAQVKALDALKYVPGGTIVQSKKDEVKIKTAKGGIVELEFKRNGKLEEASGDMIEKDDFVPGKGHLSLDKISTALKEQGYQLRGDWSYDKSFKRDWHYEVDARQNNQSYELVVDAKTAQIIDKEIDD